RAALLAKADLVSEMVGEFPELQGVMGHYYALNDGEDKTVAKAIEQHYYPRFAGDSLPESDVGIAVALADKLETLIGIWGIGLKPTGDKDPYALRRAALGVMRMLMLKKLDMHEILKIVFNTFPDGKLSANTIDEVSEFMMARLEIMLQSEFSHDEVASVLSVEKQNINDIPNKLAAVAKFKSLPESSALISANKRVRNILKKNQIADGIVDESLLQQAEEQALYRATKEIAQNIVPALSNKDFNSALTALARIKPTVDDFFEKVMVMAEDEKVRNNRLYLLQKLSSQMNAVADISLLINSSDEAVSN
ncbi:MAG: glycine--tRNA ligase subunit beta, partial [Neisseriaceae bacterium]|nr:glycine--tRNA ligase subunit beta [Neisseriaceae bacterium]